jgi:hypothetical protein
MAESANAEGTMNDWRQLCAAAATEQDSAKLTSLVNQIIKALDDQNPRLNRTTDVLRFRDTKLVEPQPVRP